MRNYGGYPYLGSHLIQIGILVVALSEQIDPVHNKKESCIDILFRIIIPDNAIGKCRQPCFPATLCMPDDPAFSAVFESFYDLSGRKKLRIAHNVLFRDFPI